MNEYPEHEKLDAVKEQSQAIGEFLDLAGYTLCEVVLAGNNGEPRYIDKDGNTTDEGGFDKEWNPDFESWNDHWRPVGTPIQTVLARWFEIDLDALEREKRAMLDSLRAAS